jgi:CRP-like cAMP-binding protein
VTALQEPLEPGTNKLLAALPRRERDRLLPHLESVVLEFEETLYEQDELIRHIYFPTSGLISLLLVLDGRSVAEVGRCPCSSGCRAATPEPWFRFPARPSA